MQALPTRGTRLVRGCTLLLAAVFVPLATPFTSAVVYERARFVCDDSTTLRSVEARLDEQNQNIKLCASASKFGLCIDRVAWKMQCRSVSLSREVDAQVGLAILLFVFFLFCCSRA